MSSLGPGRPKKLGRRTVESTPALDVNYLSAMGCLHSGWSGICRCADGDGVYSIHLRAGAGQLRLYFRAAGWLDAAAGTGGEGKDGAGEAREEQERSEQGAQENVQEGKYEGAIEIIPIVHTPCRYGGDRAYFICPGPQATAAGANAGAGTGGVSEHRRVRAQTDAGGANAAGANAGADTGIGCGRRLTKLYLVNRYFLCRHCAGLVYASPYEQKPWQRALRRARLLRQRLGSADTGLDGTLDGAPEKPVAMSVDIYAQSLDAILQAEIQAYQGRADWTRRFVARIVDRTKPEFTL